MKELLEYRHIKKGNYMQGAYILAGRVGELKIVVASHVPDDTLVVSQCTYDRIKDAFPDVRYEIAESYNDPEKLSKQIEDRTLSDGSDQNITQSKKVKTALCEGMPHGSCKGETMCDPNKRCFTPA
jgi:hypothetical protein